MNTWIHRTVAVLLGSLIGLALVPGLGSLVGFEPPLFGDNGLGDDYDYMCPGGELSYPFGEPAYDWTYSQSELDLLEVALRDLFENDSWNPGELETADHVFLGLRRPDGIIDPPAGLLSRFADSRPLESALPNSKKREGNWYELIVEYLHRIDDTAVDVEITNGLSSGHIFRVEQQDGEWVVVEAGLTFIG